MNLKELLNDHQTGMSQFQDDYLVTTRAGGTLYGQYKQALRELYKRFRGLRELTCNNERLKIDIEELEFDLKSATGFPKRRKEVDCKEKIMLMEESERSIKDTKREFNRFYQQATYLKEQIGKLTDEKRHQLDMEMWEFKIKEMAVIDLVTTGRIRNVTYEFLSSVPKDMKMRIAFEIRRENQDTLIDWYDDKEEYHIPKDLPKVELSNTKEMLLIDG
ncbi:MAG: hypothetical protein E3J43_08755 [Candidatus Heimdallarchaeota archaeon]|nr:MAG: hypothetical protein E3J43_08755 [Candidatus Heimdallarchaeota archaeon]